MKNFFVTFIILLSVTSFSKAQEENPYFRYLTSDLKLHREIIMTDALKLTEAENTLFVPSYQEYLQRSDEIIEKRKKARLEYFNNFEELDAKRSVDICQKHLAAEEEYNKLLQSFVKRFERMIGPKNAAIFWQTETAIQLMFGFQEMQETPLIIKRQ